MSVEAGTIRLGMGELKDYRYRGARALVLLHERHLRDFVDKWRQAKSVGVTLPRTSDKNYSSLETLLGHVLGAARGYMIWTCDKLELPEPELPAVPQLDEVEAQADEFVTGLLEGWRLPLRDVPEARFEGKTYSSPWGDDFSIDAMLEHAVMHPIRHSFQLDELIRG